MCGCQSSGPVRQARSEDPPSPSSLRPPRGGSHHFPGRVKEKHSHLGSAGVAFGAPPAAARCEVLQDSPSEGALIPTLKIAHAGPAAPAPCPRPPQTPQSGQGTGSRPQVGMAAWPPDPGKRESSSALMSPQRKSWFPGLTS